MMRTSKTSRDAEYEMAIGSSLSRARSPKGTQSKTQVAFGVQTVRLLH